MIRGGVTRIAHIRGGRALRLSRGLVETGGERRGGRGGGLGLEVLDENEDLRVAVVGARPRSRVALDHALRGEEGLDLFTQLGDAVVLLR